MVKRINILNFEEIKQAFASTCYRTRIKAHFFCFDAWVVTLAEAATFVVFVAVVALAATLVLVATSVLAAVVVVLATAAMVLAAAWSLDAAVVVALAPVTTGLVARGAAAVVSSPPAAL